MYQSYLRRLWQPMSFLCLLVSAAGCHTINMGDAINNGELAPLAEQAEEAEPQSSIFVELYPKGRKPKLIRYPLKSPTTAGKVLQDVRARRMFRRMSIEVVRMDGNRQVKMGVQYDRKKRQVAAHTDYALGPNDRLVVTEDDTPLLEQILGEFTSAMGG